MNPDQKQRWIDEYNSADGFGYKFDQVNRMNEELALLARMFGTGLCSEETYKEATERIFNKEKKTRLLVPKRANAHSRVDLVDQHKPLKELTLEEAEKTAEEICGRTGTVTVGQLLAFFVKAQELIGQYMILAKELESLREAQLNKVKHLQKKLADSTEQVLKLERDNEFMAKNPNITKHLEFYFSMLQQVPEKSATEVPSFDPLYGLDSARD